MLILSRPLSLPLSPPPPSAASKPPGQPPALMPARRRAIALACAGLLPMLAACAGPPANERETGSGGTLVRYSSRQVDVDLTDAERQALHAMRDRTYADAAPARTLDAAASALTALGFAPVSVDRETGLVEAGRSETLVPKWRQLLRGALKSYTSMFPAKSDHERMKALVMVRAEEGGRASVVRARFERTVWDSNGDSRTKTVLEREVYDGFFAQTAKALCPAACKP